MSLQLVRLVERITRNFGEKMLTSAVFLNVAKIHRYRLDRWLLIQANASKLSVLHSPYNLILPQGSDVLSVLPDGHVISSRHADWGSSGWIDLLCPLQSVCQRHALTLAPHGVDPLRGRHGHHNHVPQADTVRQLPGFIRQRSSMVVE